MNIFCIFEGLFCKVGLKKFVIGMNIFCGFEGLNGCEFDWINILTGLDCKNLLWIEYIFVYLRDFVAGWIGYICCRLNISLCI